MSALRAIYRWWAALLVLGVLIQIGAAGYGAFYVAGRLDEKGDVLTHKGFENGWDFHAFWGYMVFFGTIILLVLALLARIGRPGIWFVLAAPLLLIVQILLAWFGSDTAVVGIFHPLNAFVILGLTGSIAAHAWRGRAAHSA
jgi:preprotein translocase subunit SecG